MTQNYSMCVFLVHLKIYSKVVAEFLFCLRLEKIVKIFKQIYIDSPFICTVIVYETEGIYLIFLSLDT